MPKVWDRWKPTDSSDESTITKFMWGELGKSRNLRAESIGPGRATLFCRGVPIAERFRRKRKIRILVHDYRCGRGGAWHDSMKLRRRVIRSIELTIAVGKDLKENGAVPLSLRINFPDLAQCDRALLGARKEKVIRSLAGAE